jgi:tetratricopeptide (TPR) repeat protein
LIEYEQGDFIAALDYFGRRTLQFGPRVAWARGAHYNVARCLEASGQRSKAIDTYEKSILLRNDTGNLLRARWLKELDRGKNNKALAAKPEAAKLEERKMEEKKIEAKKADEKKADEKKADEK